MSAGLAALFTAAVSGVLVVVGLALAPLGWPALAPYLVLVALAVGTTVRRARAVRRAQQTDGRTCTCCTSTVYDAVEVR